MGDQDFDVAIGKTSQALARGATRVQCREALFQLAAMPFDVPRCQGFHGGRAASVRSVALCLPSVVP